MGTAAPRIVGIVLAAGRSRRMGRPKPLLPWGDTTALGAILRACAGAGIVDVRVVLGPDAPAIVAGTGCDPRAVLVNPTPDAGGQIGSLRLGLAAARAAGADAVLAWPVDHPGVSAALVRRLVDAWRAGRPPVVRPRVAGRGGHPAIFDAAVFSALLGADADEGARAIVEANRAHEASVDTDERAAVEDLDTPDDYARAAPP